MMRLSACLMLLLTVIGCHSASVISKGNWGDRDNWRSDTWTQDYFAESDGHLVGWVENTEHLSIRAHCADAEDSAEGVYVGAFQTQEDAQAAVEKHCPVTR